MTSSADQTYRPLRGSSLALTILVVALWGGNTVAVSFSVDTLPPVAVACMRFMMGTVVMVFWCRFERTPLSASADELRASFIAGTLLFAQIATFNVAVKWTNSTHGAMLINTFPFFVAAIGHWITKSDRLTPRRTMGLVFAAVGVAAVMLDKRAMTGDMRSFLIGDVVLLLSAILLAIRVVYVGRAVQRIRPSKLIFWHDVFGVMMFAAWSMATESLSSATWTLPSALGLLYQGVVVAGFCFIIHAALLKHHSAAQISVFSFASPVFGVVFSIALRNEPLTASVVAGAALVAFGIWAVTYEPRPR